MIILITSVSIALTYPSHLQAWANFLGIMGAIYYFLGKADNARPNVSGGRARRIIYEIAN
jgi:hypothetical protein